VQRDAQLIPLGIDRPPALDPAQRRALGLPEDAFLMVTVGRVVPRKATTQLVQALTAGQRAAVHLVIIGDGPDAAAVRRAAAEAGVAERVHWLGQVSDEKKYQVLSVADIFVSASQHEGFGLVFLEAMAFGLPVVCYDHGGQTDFLVNGETGYVLPLNDLGLFTQAIRNLYDRPEERRRMAERNRRLVEEFFIDTCAKRYETVFEEAVRGFAAHRGAA